MLSLVRTIFEGAGERARIGKLNSRPKSEHASYLKTKRNFCGVPRQLREPVPVSTMRCEYEARTRHSTKSDPRMDVASA